MHQLILNLFSNLLQFSLIGLGFAIFFIVRDLKKKGDDHEVR